MTDPLVGIETAQHSRDMGKLGANVFMGAREEGQSRLDAFFIVAAFYLAAWKQAEDSA